LKSDKEHFLIKLEKSFASYSTLLLKESIENTFSNSYSLLKNNQREFFNKSYHEIWIANDLRLAQSNVYQLGFWKKSQNILLLSIIDFYWTEHIERMNYIRDTINWRSYGQQNPLIEYNIEAFQSYKTMLEQIRSSMLYYFLENPILNLN
jgi:preprotein translocase subunit SecA